MKRQLILSQVILFLCLSAHAQDYTGHFTFDEKPRSYEVYLPQNFEPNMPLVISIHGSGETVYWYKTYTAMHEVADTMGFVLVYPQGIGNSWTVGHGPLFSITWDTGKPYSALPLLF